MSDLLRDTLELTLARDDTFPTRFYEHLFAAHPEVRPLFHRSSPGALNKMFVRSWSRSSTTWTIRRGSAASWVGSRPVLTDVTPEVYPWVGTR
jgi:hemoglobin-like flavoprotein